MERGWRLKRRAPAMVWCDVHGRLNGETVIKAKALGNSWLAEQRHIKSYVLRDFNASMLSDCKGISLWMKLLAVPSMLEPSERLPSVSKEGWMTRPNLPDLT